MSTPSPARFRLLRLLALTVAIAMLAVACGGGGSSGEVDDASSDDTGADAADDDAADEDAADEDAADEDAAASDEELVLRMVWFEWAPATALEDFANEHYVDPNVSFEVETVPFGQWHDAIFTQFAAGETSFDIPILDSQFIGEAVTGNHITTLTDFANEHIELDAYPSNLLAAYAQYPVAADGQFDPDGDIHGLPLLADTWVLVYRKDLVGEEPPGSWEEMLEVAAQCQADNPGMAGLAFHGAPDYDTAGITLNQVIWVNGGEIWDGEGQVEGVINDETGLAAIDQLVNEMVPLAPEGVGTAFIGEVNAAINQGQACMGMNWVAGLEGMQDPANSTLGETEEEILEKLGFAELPDGAADVSPMGGMGMHVSAYSPNQQAALDFMEWFSGPEVQEMWAEAGGVPARTDALNSEAFLNARPWNQAFTDSVDSLKDFWAIPEFFQMIDVHSTQANAAITGTQDPADALNALAEQEQTILDGGI
ncbi:Maltose/maltodextrin ABC transporter, substrate binding periplasmic protein MalE [Euzebya pacifica]|uniref:Maltose/maltodextrin ABC transporter, substrate binding periplasmic protein MalE n=1 Tax=Euzebya pacifica TaxID=1608957 RepID=A0A346Y513_9ACTN|nr:extracellular solute-binding protein [Euzebya pacifica]AXV09560.1 Maltose/maltodextrin ABC transporter, substrate binding periplasmic protein MalE [Euzebya pacifica]